MKSCHIVISILMISCLFGQCCTGELHGQLADIVAVIDIFVLPTGQCMFEYQQQPVSTTIKDCNPYGQNGYITITLDCIVIYQTDEFEIRWFRENTTGAVEDLGLGYPNRSQENMRWYSRYHEKDFFNQQYNSSYLGKYWCQVINTTAYPDQPLMRSNVFTLLAPENYTQPTCVNQSTSVQSVNNLTCADLSYSEQTILPASTTTLSSYVSDKSSCFELPDCTTISKDAETKGKFYSPTIDVPFQPSQITIISGAGTEPRYPLKVEQFCPQDYLSLQESHSTVCFTTMVLFPISSPVYLRIIGNSYMYPVVLTNY